MTEATFLTRLTDCARSAYAKALDVEKNANGYPCDTCRFVRLEEDKLVIGPFQELKIQTCARPDKQAWGASMPHTCHPATGAVLARDLGCTTGYEPKFRTKIMAAFRAVLSPR